MLKFNNLRKLKEGSGSPAGDFTKSLTQDDDEEATTYKPRSKGEEDFANKHTKDTKAHPVAPEVNLKVGQSMLVHIKDMKVNPVKDKLLKLRKLLLN